MQWEGVLSADTFNHEIFARQAAKTTALHPLRMFRQCWAYAWHCNYERPSAAPEYKSRFSARLNYAFKIILRLRAGRLGTPVQNKAETGLESRRFCFSGFILQVHSYFSRQASGADPSPCVWLVRPPLCRGFRRLVSTTGTSSDILEQR